MTDSPHRGREEQSGFSDGRTRSNRGQQLSRIHRSGVCEPGALRPHLPGTAAPAPTERLPAYSPYGYDPYSTGQYGPQYPPGSPPQPPPPDGEPKSPRWLWVLAATAVLAVIGLVDRAGHRLRQQLEPGDGRRAAAVADGAQLPHTHSADDDAPARPRRRCSRSRRCRRRRRRPARPGPRRRAHRDRGLQRDRRRPGHQHHLHRQRRTAADGVQRDAAVEQGSRIGRAGKGLRERQHHQRRPRGELLDHRQRRDRRSSAAARG